MLRVETARMTLSSFLIAILAQASDGGIPPYDPGLDGPPEYDPYGYDPYTGHWFPFWMLGGLALFNLLYAALALWMAVECLRKDPDRYLWIWVIFFIFPVGPILYFFLRWLPSTDVRLPHWARKWTRGYDLRRLETAAKQIGNAHQFVQWGDLEREVGNHERAAGAYQKALGKDPANLQALWGAALVDLQSNRFPAARERLEKILAIDPQYKFGDVSLAYGKALLKLNEVDASRAHLEKHICRWRHPEALYLLATIQLEQGQPAAARETLDALILDIHGSPKAIARRHTMWYSRAKRLLRRIPKNK
jgi:hypothetical protein